MAQQVKNVAGKFGGKSVGALLGLAGFGYAATQSFYSGKISFKLKMKNNAKKKTCSFSSDYHDDDDTRTNSCNITLINLC